jgi:hypothetical protein
LRVISVDGFRTGQTEVISAILKAKMQSLSCRPAAASRFVTSYRQPMLGGATGGLTIDCVDEGIRSMLTRRGPPATFINSSITPF